MNAKTTNALFILALGFLTVLTVGGCTVAKFDAVSHESKPSENSLSKLIDEDRYNILDTDKSKFECNGITVDDYPKTHQVNSLNPNDMPQPKKFVLRFDNMPVINFLDHSLNAQYRNLTFTSESELTRTSVFIDTLEDRVSGWLGTNPSDPEISCMITKEVAKIGNPKSVDVRMDEFEVDTHGRAFRVHFSTSEEGYRITCHKNMYTPSRRSGTPLTLAGINAALCGIATVYVK